MHLVTWLVTTLSSHDDNCHDCHVGHRFTSVTIRAFQVNMKVVICPLLAVQKFATCTIKVHSWPLFVTAVVLYCDCEPVVVRVLICCKNEYHFSEINELNKSKYPWCSCLDLHLEIDSKGGLRTKLYDKSLIFRL